jgi:putative membrane protein
MISIRTGNKILSYSALILLANLTAFGQNSNGLPKLGSTDSNAIGPHTFADQAFVKSVMERDAAEEQMGQLAQQKAQNEDVKELGKKTVDARTSLDAQLKVVANSLEVSPPKGPSKKDSKLIASLQALSGGQFDTEYIKAIDKAHKQDIKDIQIEIQNTQDSAVRQAAQQIEGILSQYLQVIEQVAKNNNVALDSK